MTVSYFEQVHNAYDYCWDLETVHERLDKKMTAAFHAVHEAAQKHGVNNRGGAYVVAVRRVAEACTPRGWVQSPPDSQSPCLVAWQGLCGV